MTYSIRKATQADASVLHALILALADYEKLLSEATRGSDADALGRHLHPDASPRVEAFLAEDAHGEALGFALCYHHYSTFHTNWGLYLEDLFVRPEHRGRGIGLALMREVARLAIERGCVRLEWQVLDWNETAIDFYRGLGARSMDEWITMRMTGEALTGLAGIGTQP